MTAEATVIKQGELCVQIVLGRSAQGLQVTVRAHPAVEDFFRNDAKFPVDRAGKHWIPVSKPLEYYNGTDLPICDGVDGFRMDVLGRAFDPVNDALTNLSFLRLAGISSPEGVSFGVKGAYSMTYVRDLRDKIAAASKRFYSEYLKPVDFVVTVATQQSFPGGW